MPHWLGIPGAILLIGLIVYGFRQGGRVTTRQQGDPPENTDGYNHH